METIRLALARKSKIEREGVSSIYKGASRRSCILKFSRSKSSSVSFPVRNLSEVIPVSEAISLVISCMADISKEKKATGILLLIAIFLAIVRVKAVFPIAGRAATMIRSVGCQPAVISSTLVNPQGTPLNSSFFLCNSFIFSRAFSTNSLADSEVRVIFP